MNDKPFYRPQWHYLMHPYWYPYHHYWNWHPYDYSHEYNRHHDGYAHYRSDIALKDYGGEPFVVDIERAAKQNQNYRIALWTGSHLQVTLMSIDVGGDIGLEMHPDVDQFIRIEQGQGLVQMGDRKDLLDFEEVVFEDYAVMIPAGKWHNLINTGNIPIKLYSIYAPPEHPFGTVHETKAMAIVPSR